MAKITHLERATLSLFLSFAFVSICAAADDAKVPKTVQVRPTVAIDGKTLFRQYCAVCHGADGRGNGPSAAALKQSPADLTSISRRNHGKFPDERMMRILQGSEPVTAHGTQEMPVWGPLFYEMSNNLSLGQTRVHAVLDYLQKIQEK